MTRASHARGVRPRQHSWLGAVAAGAMALAMGALSGADAAPGTRAPGTAGPTSDHGAMDHGAMDHGAMDHGAMDHGVMDHAAPASAPASPAPAAGHGGHGGHGAPPAAPLREMPPAVAGERATDVANYTLDAVLDPDSRVVSGSQELVWRNTTGRPADSLCFHLYLNGFRNSESTFMAESGGSHRSWDVLEVDDPWGGVDVSELEVDGAPASMTVNGALGTVTLAEPIPPGGESRIRMRFTSRMPRVFARTGYADTDEGRFFMGGQWFPKIGVYTEVGWMCDDFHHSTEFFSDFGSYDVRLTVPEGFVVGATGTESEPPAPGDNGVVHHFLADRVHDFAWTAWPGFRTLRAEGPGGVELVLLYAPDHETGAAEHLEAVRRGLELLESWLGPYPYPRLTVVDPPEEAGGAGGMEYPTLITTHIRPWLLPGQHAQAVGIAYHELTHQYFYGLLAFNEPREAFLDEGLTTYYTLRIADEIWGETKSMSEVLEPPVGLRAALRIDYGPGGFLLDPTAIPAWRFQNRANYRRATYRRMALAMMTLEGLLGRETFDRAMKLFFERFAFTHPTLINLERTFSEVASTDLAWFFDSVLRNTGEVDYRIGAVISERVRRPRGIFAVGDDKAGPLATSAAPGLPPGFVLSDEDAEAEPELYDIEMDIERHGAIIMPIEFLVEYEDGSTATGVWDREDQLASASAWYRLLMTSDSPLLRAELDPAGKLALDLRTVDNGRHLKAPAARAATRHASTVLLWLQTAMQLVGF